jgi:hypothetical protein
MRKAMRMLVSATTVLGLVLLALAAGGISSLASDLEAATPQRVPAPASEELTYESRRIACPLQKQEHPRI